VPFQRTHDTASDRLCLLHECSTLRLIRRRLAHRRGKRVTEKRRSYKRVERSLANTPIPTTTAAISERMGKVRHSGTDAERRVRRAATSAGLHYRLANRRLPGSPDLANQAKKWAIFVHGCFWHRHSGCRRATTPKSNRTFWTAKFDRNQERDRRVARVLRAMGFVVLVIWECETASEHRIATRLSKLVGLRINGD
jgi:DNA mismatch endonuclease (patch repair protein)